MIKSAGYEPVGEGFVDAEKDARKKEVRSLGLSFLFSLLLTVPIVVLSFPEMFKINIANTFVRNVILLVLAIPVAAGLL